MRFVPFPLDLEQHYCRDHQGATQNLEGFQCLSKEKVRHQSRGDGFGGGGYCGPRRANVIYAYKEQAEWEKRTHDSDVEHITPLGL